MNIDEYDLVAPLTDPESKFWLAPFVPGLDLVGHELPDQIVLGIAFALAELGPGADRPHSQWKKKALKEALE